MWLAIAAINLAIAVVLGAFGAHGLKTRASAEQLTWWHTSTEYFFYHAIGLLALAILVKAVPLFPIKISFISIQIGILFFCGSLYCMSFGLPRILGAITPIGGLFMIIGWLVLAWQAIRFKG
ncbi:DUF423 domain-containing protein [Acinetobacter apis]|uniref:Uncharacterized membrane protein YgdD, TMEM256/DUF423 family n=1 Tax=Acinetobacter apis TaxID=1229165 RepID=A0A217EEK9_9GAMM|nr:DUF423 domain-containing protein [Acinetobacter apis]SNQ28722.1 Uncharacterized membrane protein YgdD, TMEM256/DUF423 family [Acinetobacter apis]